jgi:hypothetical protein
MSPFDQVVKLSVQGMTWFRQGSNVGRRCKVPSKFLLYLRIYPVFWGKVGTHGANDVRFRMFATMMGCQVDERNISSLHFVPDLLVCGIDVVPDRFVLVIFRIIHTD